jgi:hypothetical protein
MPRVYSSGQLPRWRILPAILREMMPLVAIREPVREVLPWSTCARMQMLRVCVGVCCTVGSVLRAMVGILGVVRAVGTERGVDGASPPASAKFWCQSSCFSKVLVPANFWCQPTSGVSKVLVPEKLWWRDSR